jgi:3-oxoacyl-[acyl-carrier protein] reductase
LILFIGANSRLALDCAGSLAKEGPVIGICRRATDETRSTYRAVFEMDYARPHLSSAQLDQISEGPITVVNFAALKVDKLFVDTSPEDVAASLDINLKLNWSLLPPIIRRMMSAKWGRIVLLSSTGAVNGDVGISTYAAAKAGLAALARVLAKEYGRFGITTNVLELGYFDSPMFRALPEEKKKQLLRQIPSRKLGTGDDIAEALKFVMRCAYVNGAVLPIDGGA